ncbi:MAG: type IV secretion system protein [Synergistaceae bacterium]|nr:type IV secretion system protein [Synergistaceae bacterium]
MEEYGSRNWILTAGAACVLWAVCGAGAAWAADAMAAAPITDLIGRAITRGRQLGVAAHTAATQVFWTLALLQLTWAAVQLALRGEWTMSHVISLLVKEIVLIGFFAWLLGLANPTVTEESQNLMLMFARGIRRLSGTNAGAVDGMLQINPVAFLAACLEGVHRLTKTAFDLGVSGAVWAVVPYALTLVSFSFAAAFAVVYLLEYYVVVPAGLIFIGLGGLSATKPFALNYVKVLISVGLKLLCLSVVITVATPLVGDASDVFSDPADVASDGFFQHAFMFAAFSTVIFLSIKTIPQYAANLVTGAFFSRINWIEPGSFPPAPIMPGFTPALATASGTGSSEVNNISVTGDVQATVRSSAAGGGFMAASPLPSEVASAARENANFRGAGFGNFAQDVIFDGGMPDARPAGRMADARPAAGMPDAMARGGIPDSMARGGVSGLSGFSDATSRGGTPDSMARGGAPDSMGRGGTPDSMARGGAPDSMGRGGTPDAMARGGLPDAMGRGGMPDSMARGGTPDAMARGGTPDAMARGGMPDAMARGGEPDAMPRGGMPDAMARGGEPDAMPRGGMPDAMARGGEPDAMPRGGIPDAMARGGEPDAMPRGGMSDAMPRGGTPDAMPRGGTSDALSQGQGSMSGAPPSVMSDMPPATSNDMRNAVRDSMNSPKQ